jgi:hypothetical protein
MAILLHRVIVAGWFCVGLSAVFLYLSRPSAAGEPPRDVLWWAVTLMAARLCGIGAFVVGCIAIYNQRWTHGVILLLLSVVLPAIAFHFHGTF